MVLPDRLATVVDGLQAADLAGRPAELLGEDLVALRTQIDRLEAEWLRRLEAFDRRGAAGADGAVSTVAWLRSRCHVAPGAARERVRVARQLADALPVTRAAFAAGAVSYPHVRHIAAAVDALPEQVRAEADTALAAAARSLDPARLRDAVVHLRHAVEPERLVAEAADAHARRHLHVSRTFEGMVAVDGMLDPVGGAALITALGALMRPDPPEAAVRSPAQRRADALADLARLVLDGRAVPQVFGERPHVSVVVDLETLGRAAGAPAARLDWSGPVCGETARRVCCDAGVSRVVTAGESTPLDVGRRTQSIPPALRRALAVRDDGCVFPGCRRPVVWCEGHHVIHWADGGQTALDNLVLLCTAHHHAVHEGGWTLEVDPSGQHRWIRPRAGPRRGAA